jgi:alpha-L-fucosidase
MAKNNESIYGTSASPLGAIPWGRCTTKQVGDKWRLYLHVFDWPTDGKLRVPLVGNESSKAWMLDGNDQLRSRKVGNDIVVDVPTTMRDADATVVVLELPSRPIVYKAPVIQAEADIFVESLSVKVTTASQEAEVRYTVDGTDPLSTSSLYEAPVSMHATGVFKARAFHKGRPVSDVAERRFIKVEPLPAVKAGRQKGLLRLMYKGDWNVVPDFGSLVPTESATTEKVQLGAQPFPEYVGLRLDGTIDVPANGVYRFKLTSDDGSKLWIDGELIVDNDGLHGSATKEGAIALAKGAHTIRIDYFNKTGGSSLALAVAGSGQPFAEVPATVLKHE